MKQKNNEQEVVGTIDQTFGSTRTHGLQLLLEDDAALWAPRAGREAILTCDWFLEGSHFVIGKHPAEAVGWKCLARAVSDVAAMGGEARCFLLSLALPTRLTGKWLDEFLGGLRRASKAVGCALAGGDTTRHEKVLISITVVGEVRRGRAILRSGAEPGDVIYVSGTLGEADFGLRKLLRKRGMGKSNDAALQKHFYPMPRLALGQWLAKKRLATAMMDISDGLSTDLPRLCAASRVGARIEADSLPMMALANTGEARELALHGGDEYELLFTVKKKNIKCLPRAFRGLRLTRIGKIMWERKILLRTDERKSIPLRSGGWDPFRA
jgi:thiamine-monophosphate kinase